MTAVSWQQRLDAAFNQDEVVSIAREFGAGMDPVAVAKLPAACRRGEIVDAQDVVSYAYDLMRHDYCEADAHAALSVQHLAAFFSQAAARLSQIAAPAHLDQLSRLFR